MTRKNKAFSSKSIGNLREEAYMLSPHEVMLSLKTSREGLEEEEAKKRLEVWGRNEIKIEKKISALKIFLSQFTSPLVIMLILASLASYFIAHEVVDTILIVAIILLNGIFGFIQEYKAERSIEMLKTMVPYKVKVIREGKEKIIDFEDVVPGDVVILEEGDKVPADMRLIEVENLKVNESSLTGESIGVEKQVEKIEEHKPLAERKNMVFAGTYVERGRGKGVVVATGMNTEFGKIAKSLQEEEKDKTIFEKQLEDVSKKISIMTGVLILIIFLASWLLDNTTILDAFLISISLAVAAIPEGLPAVVTLSLAIGTRKMVKENALVRRLNVVESLGNVDVICTDKTGTLTKNKMVVEEVLGFYKKKGKVEIIERGRGEKLEIKDKSIEMIMLISKFCNNAKLYFENGKEYRIGDETELALLEMIKDRYDKIKGERIREIPFSSERKKMSVSIKKGKSYYLLTKGAPEEILNISKYMLNERGDKVKINKEDKENIMEKISDLASQGLRVLGFSYKEISSEKAHNIGEDDEKNMVFVGIVGERDPPREGVRESIHLAKNAGIKVVMITGDNLLTAKAIAKEVGIEGKAIEGRHLDEMSDEELYDMIDEIGIVARSSPIHKLRVLKAFKKKGYVVGMTGDGVNDAPALKKADVGIAMGITGTDVTKQVADMILLDDNFSTIIKAVKQGRTIFNNIRKFVNYLLSANFAEVGIVFIGSLFGYVVLKPVQLLWINLMTDGAPAIALGMDPSPPDIMNKDHKKNKKIMDKKLTYKIIIGGIALTLTLLFLFFQSLREGIIYMQTIIFSSLVFYEFLRIWVIRKEEKVRFRDNMWLVFALAFSSILQLIIIYTPLRKYFGIVPITPSGWVYLLLGGMIFFFLSYGFEKILER